MLSCTRLPVSKSASTCMGEEHRVLQRVVNIVSGAVVGIVDWDWMLCSCIGRAEQGRAEQGRAGQGGARQGRAEQGRVGQGKAGQGGAGQGGAGQGWAGLGSQCKAGQVVRQIGRPCLGFVMQDANLLATMSLGSTLKPCLMPACHVLSCSAVRAFRVDQLPWQCLPQA